MEEFVAREETPVAMTTPEVERVTQTCNKDNEFKVHRVKTASARRFSSFQFAEYH